MIILPTEKNMTRGRKRKRQKGGTIRPSSIVPFLESSTIMPGAYLNRKKKKKWKGRGLLIGQILGKNGTDPWSCRVSV